MAARLRKELGTEVDLVHGRYGEFRVLVDDQTVIDGGSLAFLGVLPSTQTVLAAVHHALSPDHPKNPAS